LALSFGIPVLAYGLLRLTTGLSRVEAAAVSAHYGSISAVTLVAVMSVGIDPPAGTHRKSGEVVERCHISSEARRRPRNPATLAAFIVLVVGGGMAVGALTGPDAWFAGLAKPSFNPPNWLFAPVWTVLYIMIGIAGWLVWTRARASAAMQVWWGQLVLNFLWSPVFFGLHRIGLALAIIGVMALAIWGFVALTARRLPWASALFVPYGLWVSFATVLNGTFWLLNRGA
jgi:tryptophan-rich sensory protein